MLPLLILLALAVAVEAQDYTYTVSNSKVTITRYTGLGGAVTIPGTINGWPVAGIGFAAFDGCTSLTSVTIPNSVTSIGGNAFLNCSNMTGVTIGTGVNSIGDSAFWKCSKLTSVTIPNSVTSIGNNAFFSCTKLASVNIGSNVASIGNNAFESCTSLTSVTIPNSVTSLGGYAFSSCSGLSGVTIGNRVTSIPTAAFQSCSSLTNITIPNSVTSIGDYAFLYCTSLPAVTIPNSVTSIGYYAFCACTSLRSVTIPNSVTSIGYATFNECSNLGSVALGTSVSSIEDYAFYACTSLHGVTIPNSVTSIGYAAFYKSGLTGITIPASVTSIADWALAQCSSLPAITVDLSNAFYISTDGALFKMINKSQFTLIQCPGGKTGSFMMSSFVTNIGDGAFSGCSGLTAITVATSNAFYSSLDGVLFNKNQTTLLLFPPGKAGGSYTIPGTVTGIAGAAFSGCTRLTALEVAAQNTAYAGVNGVLFDKNRTTLIQYPPGKTGGYTVPTATSSLGSYAFLGCATLGSVTIPGSVTSIGDGAFWGCSALTRVCFQGNAPSMGTGVFDNIAVSPTVYYFNGKTGFTSPIWMGCMTVNMGNESPVVLWLLDNGLDYNASLQGDSNGDGVNLLMAYALNLDPRQNLSNSMPRPVLAGNQLKLTFYAGRADVTYMVLSGTDLQSWSSNGVTVSLPDSNNYRTATVPMSGPRRFMRLRVSR